MKKILVPCDGSDNALRAVRYAATVARSLLQPAEIELLHVLAPLYAVSFPEPLSAKHLDSRFPSLAQRALQQAVEILDQSGVRYTIYCRYGQTAAREIVAHARDTGCDAVIMGTRGTGALAKFVMGSVATEVVHSTEIPVTLVK